MIIRLVSAACLLVGSVCSADTIGTDPIPPDFTLSGFGSSEVYRGQTFHLSSGPSILANKLTVFVGPTSDSGASFHVLLTEMDMTGEFHPTNVIFESGTLNVPPLPLRGDPDVFVLDLGGLLLQPGRDYARILDHFVVGNAGGLVSMGTGLGSFPNGTASSFPNGPVFPAGTREDHFASNNWFVRQDLDFAFQLEFTLVPKDMVDFDRDAKTDVAVYDVANGWWYLHNSKDGSYVFDAIGVGGGSQWRPVPGDYDGDGKADVAVYDAQNGWWLFHYTAGGYFYDHIGVGGTGYTAVPGDYNGDGVTDIAVYEETNGYWYIKYSSNGG